MEILPTLALTPGASLLPGATGVDGDEPFVALLAGLMQQAVSPSPSPAMLAEPGGAATTAAVATAGVPALSEPVANLPGAVAPLPGTVAPDPAAIAPADAGMQGAADEPKPAPIPSGRPVLEAAPASEPLLELPPAVAAAHAARPSVSRAPDDLDPPTPDTAVSDPPAALDGAAPVPDGSAPPADDAAAGDGQRAGAGTAPVDPAAQASVVAGASADASRPAVGHDPASIAAPAAEIAPPRASSVSADPKVEPPAQPLPTVQLSAPDHRGRPVTARLEMIDAGDGSRVRIDLEPADLGRVEVALRLDDSGAAAARFTVERPDTLQLLQRDARVVNELLSAAGFTVDQGGLDFSLRDSGGRAGGDARHAPQPAWAEGGSGTGAAASEPAPSYRRGLLDLQV